MQLGRPKTENPRKERIEIRVTPEVKAKLRILADQEHKYLAQFIFEAIMQKVENTPVL
jgi:uncharacterized protein (DUF1778 family)